MPDAATAPDTGPKMTAALETLGRVFGYDAFRGPQQEIIDHVVDGGDALVLMPTGGGKSLCYQIPSLIRRLVERNQRAVEIRRQHERHCRSAVGFCRTFVREGHQRMGIGESDRAAARRAAKSC